MSEGQKRERMIIGIRMRMRAGRESEEKRREGAKQEPLSKSAERKQRVAQYVHMRKNTTTTSKEGERRGVRKKPEESERE